MAKENGLLVIISGPSGAGKTTIARQLEKRLQAVFSVSVTTRPPAPKDLPGVDYHFVDRPTFQRMVAAGEFLEHAEVFGNLYGTPRKPVQEALQRGGVMILEIDVQGGTQVKRHLPEAMGIFILPPDDAALLARLRGRGRDAEDVVARRLAEAQAEMAAARESNAYNFFIVNDDLETAVKQALSAIRQRLARPAARNPAPRGPPLAETSMGRFDTMHHISASRAAAIFLDRDNTIIENDGDLGDPAQVKLMQGAAAAISSLRGLGYKIVVISNQGGVARGKYTEQDVQAVHARIAELVAAASGGKIDKFYFCPYHPEAAVPQYQREHSWRKPQPGMLLQAAKDLNLDMARCWIVGDQVRDVMAGCAAGVRTILLAQDPQQAETMRSEAATKYGRPINPPDFVAHNLAEAARIIGQQRRPEAAEELRAQSARTRPLALASETPAAAVPPDPARDKAAVPAAIQAPAVPVAAQPAPAPIEATNAPDRGPEPSVELTLRQILAELRNQRDKGEEISLLYFAAIFLQALAVLCFLGALWLGHADPATFWRWIVLSVVFELNTLAALLFRRR